MSTKFDLMRQAYPARSGREAVRTSAINRWGWFLLFLVLIGWGIGFATGFVTGLSVLTVLCFILTISGLFSPGLGLLGVAMFCTLDPLARNLVLSGGILRFNTFNYLLLLVIGLYIPFIIRLNDIHSRFLELFILVLGVELLFSRELTGGAQDVLNTVASFGLLVYFARAVNDQKAWFWIGIINGTLVALGGLVYYIQMSTLPYVNPNSWGYFPLTALFSICFSLYMMERNQKGKLVLLLLAVVNMVWIFMTGSRGAMLTGIVCLAYLLFITRSFSWTTLLIALAALIGYASFTLLSDQQAYALSRVEKLFNDEYTLSQRTSGRSTLMEAGLKIFKENPLGIGTGNFDQEFSTMDTKGRVKPAHSAWIKTLAENGIPGALFLTGFVFSYFFIGLKKRTWRAFLLGCLVTFTLGLGFVTHELQGKSLWFIAMGTTALFHKDDMQAYLQGKAKGMRYYRYRDRKDEWNTDGD